MVRPNAKLYRIKDYELETLVYTGKTGETYYLVSELTREVIKTHKQAFDNLCLSKIVVLAELEEILRNKLDRVHDQMRQHKIKFNPVDTPDIIYVYKNLKLNRRGEVHQYDTQGFYVTSYPSMRAGIEALGLDPKSHASRAARAIKNQWLYQNHYWSRTKTKKLNISK